MARALPDEIALRLSARLEAAAGLLDSACDPDGFRAALDVNGRVWREIYATASACGWPVTDRMVNFSLSLQARAGRGVDDDEVEAQIAINRSVSKAIARGAGTAPRGGALWLDWLDRCFHSSSN